MAVANLTKWVLKGTGVSEEFQLGWYIKDSGIRSPEDADDVLGLFSDHVDDGDSGIESLVTLLYGDQQYNEVSVYYYPTSSDPATIVAHKAIGPVVGTGAVAPQPLQAAACVTTHTARSGASYRGRMYVPVGGVVLATGHVFTSTQLDNALAGCAGVMGTARNADINHSGSSALISVYSPTLGVATQINSLSVDNRPDIQRRRANSQPLAGVRTTVVTQT